MIATIRTKATPIFSHGLRVGAGDVLFLAGIDRHVVQFLAVDQAPAVGHDGRLAPLLGMVDALDGPSVAERAARHWRSGASAAAKSLDFIK